jgi:hypothetical protein
MSVGNSSRDVLRQVLNLALVSGLPLASELLPDRGRA